MKSSRRTNLAPVLAGFALLALGGAIAAGVVHHHNRVRRALYDGAHCGRPFVIVADAATCTVDSAAVVGKRVRYYRNTPTYWLYVQSLGRPVDSLVLELPRTPDFERAFGAAMPGQPVKVERFRPDASPADAQVTLVTLGESWRWTQWNPMWRDDDALAGIVFLSLIAIGAAIGALAARRRSA